MGRKIFYATIIALAVVVAAGCQKPKNGRDGVSITGPAGADGLPGNNGSLITKVQFCPGTGVYPTVFPEVGLLIDGHLFAIYSALGGYMFEVLPGYYSSNAIGNSCSFTVNADLTVSN